MTATKRNPKNKSSCRSNMKLILSSRTRHDWASWIGTDRNLAVKKAREAQVEWERGGYGPYRILVGTLDSIVEFPVEYQLKKLEVHE